MHSSEKPSRTVNGAHDTLCVMSDVDVRYCQDTSRFCVPERAGEWFIIRVELGQ